MVKRFFLLIFLLVNSPVERAFCYSILEEGNERIEKDVKRKKPSVTLLTNFGMPIGMLLMGDFLYIIHKGHFSIIFYLIRLEGMLEEEVEAL